MVVIVNLYNVHVIPWRCLQDVYTVLTQGTVNIEITTTFPLCCNAIGRHAALFPVEH